MATYLILNTVFVGSILLGLRLWPVRLDRRYIALVLGVLLAATAVFDSLLIHFDVMRYADAKMLGLYIGKAPIEDFAYTVATVLLVPFLWKRFGKKT